MCFSILTFTLLHLRAFCLSLFCLMARPFLSFHDFFPGCNLPLVYLTYAFVHVSRCLVFYFCDWVLLSALFSRSFEMMLPCSFMLFSTVVTASCGLWVSTLAKPSKLILIFGFFPRG